MFQILHFRFTQAMVDHSPDGIVVCDLAQTGSPIIFANPAFTTMTGYESAEVHGRNCHFLQGRDVAQEGAEEIRRAMQQRILVRATLRNYRRDGSLFWNEMTFYPTQDGAGNDHFYTVVQRDVTTEVESQTALRAGHDELDRRVRERTAELVYANALLRQEIAERSRTEESLINTKTILTIAQRVTRLGTWVYDIAADDMAWSDEIFTMCGIVPQSVKPTLALATQMIHPADRSAVSREFRECMLNGRDYTNDRRIMRADGSVRHGRVWGKVIRDDYNQPVRFVGSSLDITEHREIEQALRTSQENLRLLSAHQERIKEDERKRIAREIHDELGGLLTGIKAYLSVAADQAMRSGAVFDAPLQEANRLADNAIGTVQRVITDLRPSVLDDLGIWTAIEWYVERAARQAGLEYTLCIDTAAGETELEPQRSIALFRIVQEALTNVQRHAQASAVQVSATRQGHDLLVHIRDDGKGISLPPDGRLRSWGLVGMQERIGHFGGSVDITGQPGCGTVVAVHMRLPDEGRLNVR